jgi:glucose-1-phosphate cytidylyltransferase
MKTVILAGGLGTRLSEETSIRPKPMVEIGGKPMLWHILSIYSAYGHNDFAIALGYKGEVIKKYFMDFYPLNNNLFVDLESGQIEPRGGEHPKWHVCLVDTGDSTQTGGRIKRMRSVIGNEAFMLTYGDGVANIDIAKLVKFHRAHGKLATVTAVRPPARFGRIELDGSRVVSFSEKPQTSEGWINGGFFVLEPGVFDYIDGDDTAWEKGPMQRLAEDGELFAYQHEGFWQPMDTLRDRTLLNDMWEEGRAPWKTWK